MNLKNIKLRGTVLLLTLMMCMGFVPAASAEDAIPLTATTVVESGKTYSISNMNELKALKTLVENGNTFAGATVELIKDINMGDGTKWVAIGASVETYSVDASASNMKPFSGIFNGNGFKLKYPTFEFTRYEVYGVGIFAYLKNAIVNDLNITNVTTSSTTDSYTDYFYVGGLAGLAENSTIENCSISGNFVMQAAYELRSFGGLISSASKCTIINCINEMPISNAAGRGSRNVGGIAGIANSCVIENCTNTGEITALQTAGGIVGNSSSSTIKNCLNKAAISNTYYDYLNSYSGTGGIVGYASGYSGGSIDRCLNEGAVTNSCGYTYGCSAGGIIGLVAEGMTISNCWNNANVKASSMPAGIAGMCGRHNSGTYYPYVSGAQAPVTIFNCLNTGAISSTNSGKARYGSGIVGYVGSTNGAEVENCFNQGSVLSESSGMIGSASTGWSNYSGSLRESEQGDYMLAYINHSYQYDHNGDATNSWGRIFSRWNPENPACGYNTDNCVKFYIAEIEDNDEVKQQYCDDLNTFASKKTNWQVANVLPKKTSTINPQYKANGVGFVDIKITETEEVREYADWIFDASAEINNGFPYLNLPEIGYADPSIPKVYTVTYSDGLDGTVFESQVHENCEKDSSTPAFEGNAPTRTGFIFGGWDPAVAETVTKTVTYKATWKADRNNNGTADDEETKYTVTYTDGVEDSIVFNDQVIKNLLEGDNTPAFAGTTPERTGFLFTNWMNAETKELGIAATVSGNTVYAAQWSTDRNNNKVADDEEDTYRVVYSWTGDVPDGSYAQELPEDTTEYLTGESYTLDSKYYNDFIVYTEDDYGNKNGKYTFSGWTDESNCEGTIADADIQVTGSWEYEDIELDKYAVEYKWSEIAPEGVNPPSDSTIYVHGQSYTVSDAFKVGDVVYTKGEGGLVNAAYTFEGWDAADGTIDDSSVVITGTWTRADVKTLVLKVVNGTWADGTITDKYIYVILTDGTGNVDVDDIPTDMVANEAFKAGAWNAEIPTDVNEETAAEYIYTFIPDNKNITYPEYNEDDDTNMQDTTSEIVKNKTLTVDPNTGIWTKPDDTWAEAEGKFVKVVAEDIAVISDPTKVSFTFVGWSETKDTDGNMLLTAQWESDAIGDADENGGDKGDTIPDKYQKKITFAVVNGTWADGTAEPIVVCLTLADENGKPSVDGSAALTAPKGMLADDDCIGGEWDVTPPSAVTKDIENGAVYTYSFTKNIPEYTLHFDVNGGSEIEDVTAAENTAINLDDYNSTRKGYTFKGWYTDAALSHSVSRIVLTEDTTVYAKWSSNSNGGGSGSGNRRPSGGGTLSGGDDTVTITDPIVPLAEAPGLNSTDHFAYIVGYDDNTVRPEENITRAEVATIFFRLMTDEFRAANISDENGFSDVAAGVWYNRAVSTGSKAGLINGNPDGSFAPSNDITRAEFAAIAARFLSNDAPAKSSFTDISGHWAENDINRAVQAGWIKGKGDNLFAPDAYITRAEVMTLVNRMLNRVGNSDAMTDDMVKWIDNPETAWYYADVQEATNGHKYERDALGTGEIWTEIIENRDWTALER